MNSINIPIKDVEPGKCYNILFKGSKINWLAKCGKANSAEGWIFGINNTGDRSPYHQKGIHFSDDIMNMGKVIITPASVEETEWLEQSKRAGRVVPKPIIPQINESYEPY